MSRINAPLVTVVIPAYQSEKTIRSALESVLAQTLQDFEVRILGDGCTDQTEEIVKSFKDPRLHWKNLPHTNRSHTTNQGMLDAKGVYIAHLEHDDLWFPWHLEDLIACIEKTNADFVFSWPAEIGPPGPWDLLKPPFLHRDERTGHAIPSAWLHKKEVIEKCGLWRTDIRNLRRPPDTEFFMQVVQKGTIEFCKSLSVLYFPSSFWLKQKEKEPQERYLASMTQDPRGMQRELLHDIGLAFARSSPIKTKWPRWLVRLTKWWGHDRFPLFQILRWRFLRRRRRWLSYKNLQ